MYLLPASHAPRGNQLLLTRLACLNKVLSIYLTKQRSLVITLLDLKNAFGEVHHNLIQSVLSYHHIPDHIKILIKSLYTDFRTSVITSQFNTPFIHVGRGVLQGDCLSPLLFNLCFNTFAQHMKSDKYSQFGFSSSLLNPLHWFQFADDAAVITGQESENQHLLNRFVIWCQWSDMIIRVDKCSTFGIKKALTKSIQYLPKLIINNNLVPTIERGKSFCYLGRYFDFEMSNDEHKSELISNLTKLMKDIVLVLLNCTSTLFRSLRPDVVLIYRSEVYVIELTVPYETNCLIAKRRKEERYRNLKEELMINCDSFDVITLEVTTLGFVSKDVAKFRRLLKYLKVNDNRIIAKCMEVALRATFFIYCRRNKQWNDPALLNFY